MKLSVIVPLYNEEESIRPLYNSIKTELERIDIDYELVFVDDGSKDSTYQIAYTLAEQDPKLKVVKFRKNYGQTPAMAAGIDIAEGRILITMDGDLQNDPTDIKNFLGKIEEGYDLVVGWRYDRQDKLLTRKIPSKIANWLIGNVTGVPVKDNGCSLKAYRSKIIKNVPLYSEMHRFIPAMSSITGARIAEIKVKHHARKYGSSKYGLSRIYKVILDLIAIKTIVSFASKPLTWFSILALPFALLSGIALIRVLYWLFIEGAPLNAPIAGVAILYGALAIILILSGALGELIFSTGEYRAQRLSALTTRSYERDGEIAKEPCKVTRVGKEDNGKRN